MEAKKILLITESLGSGGAERQLVGLAVFLQRKGFTVKVVTYYKNQFYEPYLRENRVDYEFLDGALDKKKRLFLIGKLLGRYQPDTVISFLPVPNMTMCLLKMVNKFRLIVSERSHTKQWGKETFVRFNLYKMADRIVCNSFSEQENIVQHYPCLQKKILTIPNFVDTSRFSPSETGAAGIRILSVGRITEQKNVLRAIEALYRLKNEGYTFEFTWIGSYYDTDYVARVKACIHEYGLEENVHILDQQGNLLPYYQRAKFFFFPSLLEGYPNVLCEAMSCGLPIVCSNVCEMPKIVEKGKNGFLFNPESVDEMVEALEHMFNLGDEEYKQMCNVNRAQAVERNSQDAFVNQYISII